MIIAGAGGLAAQMIDDLKSLYGENIYFWSEHESKYAFLRENFKFIKPGGLNSLLLQQNEFIVAVGNPFAREKITKALNNSGAIQVSFISPSARMSAYSTVEKGCCILAEVILEAGVTVKEGSLVNTRAIITHGCKVGAFCEIGPNAVLNGDCTVGDRTFIGAGAIIIPGRTVGSNVKIAAGAVVINDVPDNVLVAGVPAVVKKEIVK
jgi:sugar O-acyltransferase (sialic acid O-acetyltransferase NeuD family)